MKKVDGKGSTRVVHPAVVPFNSLDSGGKAEHAVIYEDESCTWTWVVSIQWWARGRKHY